MRTNETPPAGSKEAPRPVSILPFVPAGRSTPKFEDSQLIPFVTRQESAREEFARQWKAYEAWLLRYWARQPGLPFPPPPSTDLAMTSMVQRSLRWRRFKLHVFETAERTPPPHPLWRVAYLFGRGAERVGSGLQTALLAYYTLLGLTAFPLFASAHWVGGLAMAMVGTVFAKLLIAKLRSPAGSPTQQ